MRVVHLGAAPSSSGGFGGGIAKASAAASPPQSRQISRQIADKRLQGKPRTFADSCATKAKLQTAVIFSIAESAYSKEYANLEGVLDVQKRRILSLRLATESILTNITAHLCSTTIYMYTV